MSTESRLFLYRRGDGNDGNFPRFIVELSPTDCPFAALRALVPNERIPGSRTRRHIIRNLQTDGEAEFGILGTVFEGPDGEEAFGAAWLTAELEPYTREEADRCVNLPTYTLREVLDRAAWRQYRAELKAHA